MRLFCIEEYKTVNVDLVRAYPAQIYLIELALDGQAWAGGECVQAEPNVYGIPVGKSIAMGIREPFSDLETEHEVLIEALRKLYKRASGRKLCLPQVGIGSGPYGLAIHSPRIYGDVCRILSNHFGYSQPLPPVKAGSCESTVYHHQIFTEVCTRGGFYMSHLVAEKYDLTLDQLKAYCQVAGAELETQGRLFPLHRPTYRWACEE